MTSASWGEPVTPQGAAARPRRMPPPEPPRFGRTLLTPPPVGFLAAAAVCVAISAVLLLASGRGAEILGYLTGCVGVITFVAAFRFVDQRRRELPTYSPRRWPEVATIVLPIIGIAIATAHVWSLATELSK